eukprot:515055-Pelagomonas_calceolata.AAC.3
MERAIGNGISHCNCQADVGCMLARAASYWSRRGTAALMVELLHELVCMLLRALRVASQQPACCCIDSHRGHKVLLNILHGPPFVDASFAWCTCGLLLQVPGHGCACTAHTAYRRPLTWHAHQVWQELQESIWVQHGEAVYTVHPESHARCAVYFQAWTSIEVEGAHHYTITRDSGGFAIAVCNHRKGRGGAARLPGMLAAQ